MTEELLKKWLFVSWRLGSIGSDTSEEDDKSAFEEWYNDTKDYIQEELNLSYEDL